MRRIQPRIILGQVDNVPFEGVFIQEDDGCRVTPSSLQEYHGKRVRLTIEDLTPLVGDEVDQVRPFDSMIGRLDRLLSEFLAFAKSGKLDEADQQTIKHHADDLIGVGQAALKTVKS